MNCQCAADETRRWVDALSEALDARDGAGAAALFGDDCFWRDLAAFPWNVTIEELKGFEERKGPARPMGVIHGVYRREKTWLEAKWAEERRSSQRREEEA